MRRSFLRRAAAVAVALLLIPASFTQAATPPDPPAQLTPALADQAPAELTAPTAAAPVRDDQDLQRLGGYAAVDALRAKAAATVAAAPAAPKASKAPPVRLNTSARMPAPATQAMPGQVRATAPGPVRTASARDAGLRTQAVHSTGVWNGVSLQLGQDTFYAKDPIITTATVTQNGAPVPNATVRVDYQAAFLTDQNGVAHINMPSQGGGRVMVVGATAPDNTWSHDDLADIYTRDDNQVVTIVEQVTDETGAAVPSFDAYFYGPTMGGWGRRTDTGTTGVSTQAEHLYLEVVPYGGPGQPADLLITNDVPLGSDTRRVLHPSGSAAAPLNVTATLDGANVWGNVTLHQTGQPGVSYPQWLGQSLRATPGTYNMMLYAFTGTETLLLSRNGVQVGTGAGLSLTETRPGLGTVNLQVRDGNNYDIPFREARLHASDAMGVVDGHSNLVLATPGNLTLDEYTVNLGPEADWWDYGFNAGQSPRTVTVVASQSTGLAMGGHITPSLSVPAGQQCAGSPCGVPVEVRLRTPQGDLISKIDHYGNWVQGTVQLYKLVNGTYEFVAQRTFDPGWGGGQPNVWFDLPANPSGTYKATMEIDLGPYQGMVAADTTFSITDPASYHVTVSPQQLAPNTTQTVTVHLTNNGSPVAGQTMRLGWGNEYGDAITDGSGDATFVVTTRNDRDVVPVWMPGNGRDIRMENVYVVPPGYTLVTVKEMRDQSGNLIKNFQVGAAWYDPQGDGWDTHQDWTETGSIGLVRPTGTNDIDVWTDWSNPGLYLYQQVSVGATPFDLAFAGAGTQRLSATATVNGQPLSGGVFLHNRAKSGPTAMGNPLPAEVDVTPGAYDVLFDSDVAPNQALLLQENVDVTANATVAFTPGALARVQSSVQDGNGNSLGSEGWDRLEIGKFNVTIQHGLNHAVLPGIPLKVTQFERYVQNPAGGEYEYRFNNEDNAPPVGLVPDQQLTPTAGGPLHIVMDRQPNPPQPGNDYHLQVGLYDNHGNRVQPMQNWQDLLGHIWMDGVGQPNMWQRDLGPWDRDVWIPIPGSGFYAITAHWDGGIAFTVLDSAISLNIEPAVWLDVQVSPRVLQPDQPTQVTVTLTHNGAPYTNTTVWMPSQAPTAPDANGQVTFTVKAGGMTAWPVEARNGSGMLIGKANLFVLWPNEAGVELTGTAANGGGLGAIWGSAESVADPDRTRRTEFSENGPVGLALPAGLTDLQVQTEGRDMYLISTRVNLAGGEAPFLALDGAQTTPVNFTATMDGGPLQFGSVALRQDGNKGPNWLRGLDLDENGHGTAHISAGSYDTVAAWHRGNTHYIQPFGMMTYPGSDPTVLALHAADLVPLHFSAVYAGASQCPAVGLKAGGVRVWSDPACTVMAAPGSYGFDTLQFSEPQGTGPTWQYETQRDEPLTIDVVSGQPQSFSYDMAVTDVWADIDPNPYHPGDWLNFRLGIATADGWRIWSVRDRDNGQKVAPQSIELRDASGSLIPIGYDPFNEWNGWPVPGGNPSTAYTVTISRNLGVLGPYSASATATLQNPVKYRMLLDKEILPVGQLTAVTVILTADGRPVPNARVTLYGDSMSEKFTDARGQLVFTVTPKAVNLWAVEYRADGGQMIRAYLYAIDSRYGVLAVKAKDPAGNPMQWSTTSAENALFGTASCSPQDCRKLIVPAGPVTAVVHARSADSGRYYMVTHASVAPLSVATAVADANATVPLTLIVAGLPVGATPSLGLRNTAVNYKDNLWFGVDLPLHVTPGTYEAAAVIYAGRTAYVLPTAFTTPATDPFDVMVDAAAATATIAPSFRRADGSPSPERYTYWLGRGNLLFDFSSQDIDQVAVVPGAWQALGATADLTGGDQRWQYEFDGSLPLTVTAGQTVPVNIGGPLAAVAQPVQNPALIGGQVLLQGVARDQNGFGLMRISVFDAHNGNYLFDVPAKLDVTGPGYYHTTLLYQGDLVKWGAPTTTGTYHLHFTRDGGPFGPIPAADGSVQVIRLGRF